MYTRSFWGQRRPRLASAINPTRNQRRLCLPESDALYFGELSILIRDITPCSATLGPSAPRHRG